MGSRYIWSQPPSCQKKRVTGPLGPEDQDTHTHTYIYIYIYIIYIYINIHVYAYKVGP